MRLTEIAHQHLEQTLSEGDYAIDATAGNGHDTLFLAKIVGPAGRILAIDIQQSAIDATRERLAEARLEGRLDLVCDDHADYLEKLSTMAEQTVSAITFNLGYLPGSDKTTQTQGANTVRALNASLRLLREKGILCVTAYRGHAGGLDEANEVAKWMYLQKADGHQLKEFEPASTNQPPILWVLT